MTSYSLFVLCTVLAFVLSDSSVKESLDFLKNAQNRFKVTNQQDIILVIGNTGSGKSTLVHYVAGDNSKLRAVPSSNVHNPNFEIQDDLDPVKGVHKSTTESRTFVPEMVIDDENVVWYDCPGFDDTRNETVEIANAVFIKRIIDSAINVKFVMIVNAESVTKTGNRVDLENLLKSTTELIKNINNYSGSLSLVVTKVPPFYNKNSMVIPVSGESVKNTTAEFLITHREILEKKRAINSEKILVINSLLTEPEYDYPKISIFWKPPELGNFSDIDLLKKGRDLIRETIVENTKYSPMQSDDFGFPLTADVKLQIIGMVKQAVEGRSIILKDIHDRVQQGVNQTIKSTHDVRIKLNIIHNGQSKIGYYYNMKAYKLSNITDLYKNTIKDNGLQINDHELNQIIDEDIYLHALESLDSDIGDMVNDFSHGDYTHLFEQMTNFYQKCTAEVQDEIIIQTQQTMDGISMALKNIDQQLLVALQAELGKTDCYQYKLSILNDGKKSIDSSGNVATLDEKIEKFIDLIQNLNVTSINIDGCNQAQKDYLYLIELVKLSKFKTIIPYGNWIMDSSKAINFITTEHGWYSFLPDVYNFLASYQVQKDVGAYNVNDLSNWGNSGTPQGLVITAANFKEFIQQHSFNTLVNFSPTPTKIKELNEIIDATVNSPIKYQCDSQVATIEGNFVKSSDIQFSNCHGYSRQQTKKINVFVTDTFYVDSDVNLNGIENVELHIFANKWHILQPATINLSGIDGASHARPTTNGTAGKQGNPGSNSGNFFGVANEIVNGKSLTIQLIGGNGGSGQDGTGNQDLNITWNKIGNNIVFSPDEWYSDLMQFQCDANVFIVTEMSCEERMRDTYVLLQKDVIYTNLLFPIECCGATGTGGDAGSGGYAGYAEFNNPTNKGLPPNIINLNGIEGVPGLNAVPCKTTGLKHTTDGVFEGFGTKCEYVYVGDGTKDKMESIADTNCPDAYAINKDVIPTPPKPLTLLKSVEIKKYRRFLKETSKYPIFEKIINDISDAIAHI